MGPVGVHQNSEHVVTTAAPISHDVAVAALGLAALLLFVLWETIGLLVTMAHEGAHASVSVLLGGTVSKVELNPNRTGRTWQKGPIAEFPVVLAGYLGPSALGLLDAAMLVKGRPDAVLATNLFLLVLLLLLVRTLFAALMVVAAGAVLYLTLTEGSPFAHVLVACVWAWFLLIGGVARIWEVKWRGSDFQELRRMTLIVPAFVWATLALAAASAALLVGGSWLVGAAAPRF